MGTRENIRREIARLGYGTNLKKFSDEKGLINIYAYLNQVLRGFSMALKIPKREDPLIIAGRVIWILNRLVSKE